MIVDPRAAQAVETLAQIAAPIAAALAAEGYDRSDDEIAIRALGIADRLLVGAAALVMRLAAQVEPAAPAGEPS